MSGYDLIVIGAGPGGCATAIRLRAVVRKSFCWSAADFHGIKCAENSFLQNRCNCLNVCLRRKITN